MIERKLNIPRIGLRIIKSAVGVFLCYVVNLLRGGQGIVFYSQLAVLWCMQDYISKTMAMATQRMIGTLIGALYGLFALVLFTEIPLTVSTNSVLILLRGFMIAVFIILILYMTVLLKKKNASYFSCVVFLSIVVNHLSDSNPYLFVWNRFLDTIIGIALGVLVNCFSLPRRKNRDILFVSGIDDTLLDKNDNLSDFERVELNRMIEDGAKFTVSTMRTPATIMESLVGIKLNLPVIVMDGAALYDFNDKRYLKINALTETDSRMIIDFLESRRQPYFANIIIEDLLMIYYQKTDCEIYNTLIKKLRTSPFRNYLNRRPDRFEYIAYFMLIDKTDAIEELYSAMCDAASSGQFPADLKILKYPSHDHPGNAYIKIYDRSATRENMMQSLTDVVSCEKVVTFGTIPGKYDHVISPGDSDRVVKLMKKEYEPLKIRATAR